MKRLFACLLLTLFLTGCGGSSAPGGEGSCREGICIKLRPIEPIPIDQPVTITITVTADRNIQGLGIDLFVDNTIIVEELPGKGNDGAILTYPNGVSWKENMTANEPIVLYRNLSFPYKDRDYNIIASAITKQGMRVVDSFYIDFRHGDVKIYLLGTMGPRETPEPLKDFVGTPPTWVPTGTPIILETMSVATPTLPAYPAPVTLSPTPTQRIPTPTVAGSGTPGYPAP